MKAFIGVGSNIDARRNISKALQFLKPSKVSSVYETPALLPPGATPEWNRPFLNLAIEIDWNESVDSLLHHLKSLEKEIGRKSSPKWAPREIDLDILLFGDKKIHRDDLTVPHPEMEKRSFVLDALKDINSDYVTKARELRTHSPLWMAILNLTPDSFSDGGKYNSLESFKSDVEHYDKLGVQILDLGAESTRPGAEVVSHEEEWNRLEPALSFLREKYHSKTLRPKISIDTRNVKTAENAIEYGADIINDVSGLSEDMLQLLQNTETEYVLMHSLDVPADPKNTVEGDILSEMQNWLEEKLEILEKNRIDLGRIYFDPGIGFGKDALQSLELLKNIQLFHQYPVKILVGHSRKSFLKNFSQKTRDFETLGVSLALANQVDVLRIHDMESHIRAFRGFSHVKS